MRAHDRERNLALFKFVEAPRTIILENEKSCKQEPKQNPKTKAREKAALMTAKKMRGIRKNAVQPPSERNK